MDVHGFHPPLQGLQQISLGDSTDEFTLSCMGASTITTNANLSIASSQPRKKIQLGRHKTVSEKFVVDPLKMDEYIEKSCHIHNGERRAPNRTPRKWYPPSKLKSNLKQYESDYGTKSSLSDELYQRMRESFAFTLSISTDSRSSITQEGNYEEHSQEMGQSNFITTTPATRTGHKYHHVNSSAHESIHMMETSSALEPRHQHQRPHSAPSASHKDGSDPFVVEADMKTKENHRRLRIQSAHSRLKVHDQRMRALQGNLITDNMVNIDNHK